MPLSSKTLKLLIEAGLNGQQIVDITASIEAVKKSAKKRTVYTEAFEEFWKPYPKSNANMGKLEAWTAWKLLPLEKQDAAIRAVPAFKAYCVAHPNYSTLHACRFLKYERFERFNEVTDADSAAAEKMSELIFVKVGTPEWAAWQKDKHYIPVWSAAYRAMGWHFPTAFPPNGQISS